MQTTSKKSAVSFLTHLTALLLGLTLISGTVPAQGARNAPDASNFQWRDLSKELANKMLRSRFPAPRAR